MSKSLPVCVCVGVLHVRWYSLNIVNVKLLQWVTFEQKDLYEFVVAFYKVKTLRALIGWLL